jgi:hypothetical protein
MMKPDKSIQGTLVHAADPMSNAGKPWSDGDDAQLKQELRRGIAPAQLAGSLGRTVEEVFQRLTLLADTYRHESAGDTERMWSRRFHRAQE